MKLTSESLASVLLELTQRQIVYAEHFARTERIEESRKAAGFAFADRSHNDKNVKAYIGHIKATALSDLAVTTQLIAREMAILAFSKPSDYMEIDEDFGVLKLKAFEDMQNEQAIKKVKFGKGGEMVEVEFYDKLAALTKLGDYVGMFKERRELAPEEEVIEIEEVKPKHIINIGHRKINPPK